MNTIVISWSEWMVRVSLQATVVVCVAFVLSRVFCVWFRAPAWAELWLWRLAFVKLLLLLVITGSIAIPVLPSRQSLAIRTEAYDSNPARSQSPSVVSEAGSRKLAGPGSAVTGPVAKSQLVFEGVNVGQDGSVAVDFVEPVHVVASSSLKVNWIALLFGGWVLGVAVNVTFMLRHGRQAWCRTLSE